MSTTINIDGVEYVKKTEYNDSAHVAVICDRGWIFEGYAEKQENGNIKLSDAHVVRRWDNGLGIGGLAKAENVEDYTLDDIGSIELFANAVIASISLEW